MDTKYVIQFQSYNHTEKTLNIMQLFINVTGDSNQVTESERVQLCQVKNNINEPNSHTLLLFNPTTPIKQDTKKRRTQRSTSVSITKQDN